MKLRLNTPRAKIAAASLFVLFGSVIAAALHASGDGNQQARAQKEDIRYERKPPTAQELDEMQSSWIFSSSESASLVDSDSGFATVTIGR